MYPLFNSCGCQQISIIRERKQLIYQKQYKERENRVKRFGLTTFLIPWYYRILIFEGRVTENYSNKSTQKE